MANSGTLADSESRFDSDLSDNEAEDRLSGSDSDDGGEPNPSTDGKSGMAGVVARILSKDTSKSTRVLLAKGKTHNEILQDISKRKRLRESDQGEEISKKKVAKSEYWKEEKKKMWESMGRKMPSVLDNPKEVRLRKIATQGMVQLFRSVNEHQKLMKERLSAVGPSERKKDKVMAEFTKGKFLDLLKGRKESESAKSSDKSGKWKILQDDFMMGAQMKDWDKEENESETE